MGQKKGAKLAWLPNNENRTLLDNQVDLLLTEYTRVELGNVPENFADEKLEKLKLRMMTIISTGEKVRLNSLRNLQLLRDFLKSTVEEGLSQEKEKERNRRLLFVDHVPLDGKVTKYFVDRFFAHAGEVNKITFLGKIGLHQRIRIEFTTEDGVSRAMKIYRNCSMFGVRLLVRPSEQF